MSFLTREDILGFNDITVKEITIPENIPIWGRGKLHIKQLSRGQQDEYLKRRFGSTRMKQDIRSRQQEISAVNIFGHDAWLFVKGVCDEEGKLLFKESDIDKLNEKSGEAIGWVAEQIIEFSGMQEEKSQLDQLEKAESDIKN